jgi:hypothetical protein
MISPTEISFRDADSIRTVFARNKLDAADAAAVLNQFGEENVVSTCETVLHKERRKMVTAPYSAPALTNPDSQERLRLLIDLLTKQIDLEAKENRGICNIYPLLQYLACDLMSHIVYGSKGAINSLGHEADRKTVQILLYGNENSLGMIFMSWFPGK